MSDYPADPWQQHLRFERLEKVGHNLRVRKYRWHTETTLEMPYKRPAEETISTHHYGEMSLITREPNSFTEIWVK